MDQHTKWYIKFDITNILPLSQLYFFSFSSIHHILPSLTQYICSFSALGLGLLTEERSKANIKFSMLCRIQSYSRYNMNLYTRQPFHIASFTHFYPTSQSWQTGKAALYEASTNLILSYWNIFLSYMYCCCCWFVKCSIYLCDCLSTWGCYLRNTFFYSEDHLFLSTSRPPLLEWVLLYTRTECYNKQTTFVKFLSFRFGFPFFFGSIYR